MYPNNPQTYEKHQTPPSGAIPGQWSSGLCDCCNDPSNCLLTCCCPCVTFGQIAEIIDRGTTLHEQKFQRRNGEEQALKVTSEGGRGRGRGTYRGRGRGRGRADFNKATMECYRCHQLGHFRYECPSGNKETNYAELDEEEEMLLMSYVELYKARREDAWFLDSGCSNHMCGDRTMFNELNENFRHSVKLGNNTKMDVVGKGSVKLLLNGVNLVVAEVYYIPELRNNLLSIGQLQERGLAILIKGGMCKIFHPEKVDLEWGDGDGENEGGVSERGNGENTDGEIRETHDKGEREEEDGSSESEERVRELRQSRERQPPTWMGDYVSGEGLSEDEVHMALVESTDPLNFEEAVKSFKISRDENGNFVDETHYKQLVGSLMYLTATRPDMMFVTCLISRYMAKPMELHLQAAKRALRYLKGTVNYGIHYKKGGDGELLAFTDSDYAGDMEDRKSTSGYVFLMNSSAVSWCSKKQPIVTLSTTEAEFVAAAVCACQGVWMKRILKELGHSDGGCTTMMCDNSSTIKLSKNPVMHGRSKHIDVRFHFLRNLTKEGTIELVHCMSQNQVADIMTKPLQLEVFQKLRTLLGEYRELKNRGTDPSIESLFAQRLSFSHFFTAHKERDAFENSLC
ncbi:hypothetical protein MRB53_008419 [Persea americana]|uniref:Uncharacterized protein n=1 Tax=Persea americana TaxID=3435 RepID=A0ACC2MMN1_PERAE|nr:hypothetical protein MRB53_008419 [Persea americana]